MIEKWNSETCTNITTSTIHMPCSIKILLGIIYRKLYIEVFLL